ncbi:MAG: hypothetical protein CSB47_08275 [Proteobacteria bacterium]|nr:MAG: hypothetical protein CSB47_08275 [Pseudomonadota bacterium]
MKIRFLPSLLVTSLLLQACNAGTSTTRPTANPTAKAPQASTVANTPAPDQQYAELLEQLSQRNPNTEAQQALARGDHFLLGYYRGRAGLKIPGLNAEQQQRQHCRLTTIDGMGDVIYGSNHLKYRIAMRNFAKAFNTQMLGVCL